MRKNTDKRNIKVTLVMTVSADGVTARRSNEFVDWSSSADKKLFAEISKEAGAVIMGKNTFNTFEGTLPDRLNIVMSENPDNSCKEENLMFFSDSPETLLEELESKGYTKAVLAGGSYTNFKFYEKNLIDELIITISPIMFGSGLSVFNSPVDAELKLKDFRKIDEDTIMLNYYFKKKV
ncbi:MAG: dihydrofolate reductase family protein [Thermodesulfobacteriota bacterium]